MGPHHWSTVPEENQTSDPRAYVQKNWPAKAMGAAVRGLMATAACARDDGLGGLVAQLGASNVYAVQTNEGLIDPTTQVGGLTPAITRPFVLRLAFDTALSGSATNVPHLKVDGFDCGPILRRDLSALADGDLQTKAPVLVYGDFAAGTDTKVTRVRVLDLTPSDIKALQPATQATKSILIPGAPNTLPGFGQSKVATFGAPDDATGGLASFANGRFTVGQNGAGVWGLALGLSVAAPSGVNYGLLAGLYRNGGSNPEVTAEFVNSSIIYFGMQPISGLYPVRCAAGDYFDCYETVNYQTGGPITLSVKIAALYLGT